MSAGRLEILWTRVDPQGPPLHAPKLPGDIGYDLAAASEVVLAPGEQVDVPTNVRVRLPPGCWAEMRARSSIARRHLWVAATVIDNGYTGPLFVLLRNFIRPNGEDPDGGFIRIAQGERIAQLVLHRGVSAYSQEVDRLEDDPRRGPRGFGSTGRW